MKLTAIVAMTPQRIIGRDGTLPWHLPEDLKFFKKQTTGHPIVMGRKTFDSIGRPLPKRQNIILTRNRNLQIPETHLIENPEQLKQITLLNPHVFIIGGEQIYRAFLPHLHDLLITHVHHPYPGDTSFPEFAHLFPHSEIILEHPDFTIKRHFAS